MNDILELQRDKLKSLIGLYDKAMQLNDELKIGPLTHCNDPELRKMIIIRHLRDREQVLSIIRGLEHDIDDIIRDADKCMKLVSIL